MARNITASLRLVRSCASASLPPCVYPLPGSGGQVTNATGVVRDFSSQLLRGYLRPRIRWIRNEKEKKKLRRVWTEDASAGEMTG